jgi:hypothetical protein
VATKGIALIYKTPPPQFSPVGDLRGQPDPRIHEFSWPAVIYRIIFELNPFKFKFELGLHKLHFKKIGKNTWRCPEGVES